MEWIRSHPYASAIGAAVLLLAGMFLVVRTSTTPAARTVETFGSARGAFGPFYGPAQQTSPNSEDDIAQNVLSGPPYTYIPPSIPTTTGANTGATDPLDFKTFIRTLSQDTAPTSGTSSDHSSPADTYLWLPRDLMSTTTTQRPTRSPSLQAVYEYGNEVGAYVQSFDDQHPTAVNILKDQAEDRADPQKVAAVEALARAMREVGRSLLAMDAVPAGMASAHEALAQSYIAIGTDLALVTKAQADPDFIRAMETYNGSVDTFIKNYVALATLFGAYGVNFGAGDAGSVFTFTAASL